MSGDEIEWYTGSGMFNDPCHWCRVRRQEHDNEVLGHVWTAEQFNRSVPETVVNAAIRTLSRELAGKYSAPLPLPVERRRIRVAAGWTQQDVADQIHVHRSTVAKFEQQAGWLRNGDRRPGREPSGHLRTEYSELLRRLGNDPTSNPSYGSIDRVGR